jgi:RNA polymerase sigma-70 factor (ECF subfamily)
VQFSAAEVAELLETTPAAVNSALQRARAHLAEVAPRDDDVTEPEDRELLSLVERYCAAFENGDVGRTHRAAASRRQARDAAVRRSGSPGRDAVTRFLSARALHRAGRRADDPNVRERASPPWRITAATPRHDAGPCDTRAHPGEDGIAAITVFLEPDLFAVFGMPNSR